MQHAFVSEHNYRTRSAVVTVQVSYNGECIMTRMR